MRTAFAILLLVLWVRQLPAQNIQPGQPVRFLALGDSYTIGHSVTASERWPDQLLAELRKRGYGTADLRIIAQTGWRTDNLQVAVNQQLPLDGYNLVSLLIGVNNQFQGGSIQTYSAEFEKLLLQAIQLAGNDPRHVFVLSIPDYAFTPYGNGNASISAAIDEFNALNKRITENYRVKYIDITPISRRGLAEPALVATDGLHPSGLMYSRWVQEIVKYIDTDVGIHQNPVTGTDPVISVSGRHLQVSITGRSAYCQLFSAAGERLMQVNVTPQDASAISLERLPAGIYMIRVSTGSGPVVTKKIILF